MNIVHFDFIRLPRVKVCEYIWTDGSVEESGCGRTVSCLSPRRADRPCQRDCSHADWTERGGGGGAVTEAAVCVHCGGSPRTLRGTVGLANAVSSRPFVRPLLFEVSLFVYSVCLCCFFPPCKTTGSTWLLSVLRTLCGDGSADLNYVSSDFDRKSLQYSDNVK